jgi:hypothetical protein
VAPEGHTVREHPESPGVGWWPGLPQVLIVMVALACYVAFIGGLTLLPGPKAILLCEEWSPPCDPSGLFGTPEPCPFCPVAP